MKRKATVMLIVCLASVSIAALFLSTERPAHSTSIQQPDAGNPTGSGTGDLYLPLAAKNYDSASCDVIQNAIDVLPETGGQVIIPAGTFTCTTAIVISRSNVVLRGQGPATVLYLAAGSDSPVLVVGDTATPPAAAYNNVHISDLSIDGNRAEQTQECWGGPCDSGGRTAIRNNGITLRGVTDVRVERVSVVRARSGGLVTEKGCRRITVHGFSSAENAYDGLAGYETENSVFSELYLHDNPFAGISLDIQFNNNTISQAVIVHNGKQGIFMRDSQDNLFADIQIRESGEQGLFLAQVDTNESTPALGNTFHGLVVSHSAQAGMQVNNLSCRYNLVVAAQFIQNGGGCIVEAEEGLVEQVGVICR